MFISLGELKGTKQDNEIPFIKVTGEDRFEVSSVAMHILGLYPEGIEGQDRVNVLQAGDGSLYITRASGKSGSAISKTGKVQHLTMTSYIADKAEQLSLGESIEYAGQTLYKLNPMEKVTPTTEVEKPTEETTDEDVNFNF
jgi:hypothetical protein